MPSAAQKKFSFGSLTVTLGSSFASISYYSANGKEGANLAQAIKKAVEISLDAHFEGKVRFSCNGSYLTALNLGMVPLKRDINKFARDNGSFGVNVFSKILEKGKVESVSKLDFINDVCQENNLGFSFELGTVLTEEQKATLKKMLEKKAPYYTEVLIPSIKEAMEEAVLKDGAWRYPYDSCSVDLVQMGLSKRGIMMWREALDNGLDMPKGIGIPGLKQEDEDGKLKWKVDEEYKHTFDYDPSADYDWKSFFDYAGEDKSTSTRNDESASTKTSTSNLMSAKDVLLAIKDAVSYDDLLTPLQNADKRAIFMSHPDKLLQHVGKEFADKNSGFATKLHLIVSNYSAPLLINRQEL